MKLSAPKKISIDFLNSKNSIVQKLIESRTSNIERRTSNVERRTSNVEHRTSNVKPRTSPTPVPLQKPDKYSALTSRPC